MQERTYEQKQKDKAFVKALFEKYYPRRAKDLRQQEHDSKYHQMHMDFMDAPVPLAGRKR